MKIRNVLLAAMLTATPLAAAVAQQSVSPDIRADNTHEATEFKDGAATKTTPGATGSAKVQGDHSTVAGDQSATDRTKTGGGGGGGGGGGK